MLNSVVLPPGVIIQNRPTIIYVTSIKDEVVERFAKQVSDAQANQSLIPIVIDCFGGCPYAVIAMVNVLKSVKMPIATIIESKAMSGGAVLFSAGTKGYRYIAENASLMIHDVISSRDRSKTQDVVADANETNRLNDVLFAMLDSHSDRKIGYFNDLVHNFKHADVFLTANECVKHGLADHIGIPTLLTEVKVECKLVL